MNGIFAIEKPSGITSNQFMMRLQHILTNSQVFSKDIQRATAERMKQYQEQTGKKASKRKLRKVSKVKMGHGGTLDPLASGVLVIGIGTGTKKLAEYLSGTIKVYESEALFGVSTTSGDVEGEILSRNSVQHLNIGDLKTVEQKFVGTLKQTPPIYAALKMDGKPLHEYAREGKPLPRAIKPREVTIYDLQVMPDSLTREHNYSLLRPSGEALETLKKLNTSMLDDTLYFSKEYCEKQGWSSEEARVEQAKPLSKQEVHDVDSESDTYRAPLLHFRAKVSSGTYIRSLISDIGKAMMSSCYMVKLVRIQQKDWSLENKNVFQLNDFTERDEKVWSKVLGLVLEKGAAIKVTEELAKAQREVAQEKELLENKKQEDERGSYTNSVQEEGSSSPPNVERTSVKRSAAEL
ncbi:BN860_11738g1_1 [Zygosaccharomyces bailii CLIB 213]|uniref:tRNA pseudouridine(55) synthase n=1 Tax=Zygosaccharomyces bailii (strain CLIB 213 / ATCC 58445 / CBS 680 / BCRC 21525 / NBRC 1098 / NCYC 1416 / NRRL Y-2227) TaxID=1333698 RepID=A0A8J2X590_ZYGB2|nr:BN860_11738g1_1 [Zygosaccharomyces bailii CLIB 213]